jgi:hypothetical protein
MFFTNPLWNVLDEAFENCTFSYPAKRSAKNVLFFCFYLSTLKTKTKIEDAFSGRWGLEASNQETTDLTTTEEWNCVEEESIYFHVKARASKKYTSEDFTI